jgi:hypothetical protein
MAHVHRRYTKEEIARRGDEILERDVQPRLKPEDNGKFVAIDIETGDYEMSSDELTACDRLRERVPQAQTWLVKVGSRSVHRYGGHGIRSRA